jgi:hypothetical protein
VQLRVTVTAVDPAANTVAFIGPNHAPRVVAVRDPTMQRLLRSLRPGDQVAIAMPKRWRLRSNRRPGEPMASARVLRIAAAGPVALVARAGSQYRFQLGSPAKPRDCTARTVASEVPMRDASSAAELTRVRAWLSARKRATRRAAGSAHRRRRAGVHRSGRSCLEHVLRDLCAGLENRRIPWSLPTPGHRMLCPQRSAHRSHY